MTDRYDGMANGDSKFVFMNNQAIYRTSSIQGALVGVAIAFVVLFACTWSPLLAFCATLSILCTMMSGTTRTYQMLTCTALLDDACHAFCASSDSAD